MIDIQKVQVQRGTGESDKDFARRQRAARVTQPIFGPEALARPGETVVRAEKHVLSAGVGSLTTAETVARRADRLSDEETRHAALPAPIQMHVACGLPLLAGELLALVVEEHARTGQEVRLSRETVASALAVKKEVAAEAINALVLRGLIEPQRSVFGSHSGYRPRPR